MSFSQWEKIPVAERHHRLVLFIAEKELERRSIQESRDAQFEDEIQDMVRQEARSH